MTAARRSRVRRRPPPSSRRWRTSSTARGCSPCSRAGACSGRAVVLTYHRVLADEDVDRTWSHPAIVVAPPDVRAAAGGARAAISRCSHSPTSPRASNRGAALRAAVVPGDVRRRLDRHVRRGLAGAARHRGPGDRSSCRREFIGAAPHVLAGEGSAPAGLDRRPRPPRPGVRPRGPRRAGAARPRRPARGCPAPAPRSAIVDADAGPQARRTPGRSARRCRRCWSWPRSPRTPSTHVGRLHDLGPGPRDGARPASRFGAHGVDPSPPRHAADRAAAEAEVRGVARWRSTANCPVTPCLQLPERRLERRRGAAAVRRTASASPFSTERGLAGPDSRSLRDPTASTCTKT